MGRTKNDAAPDPTVGEAEVAMMGRTKNDAAPDPTVGEQVAGLPDAGPGEPIPGLAEQRAAQLEQENLELRRKLNDSGKMVNPMTLASATPAAPRPFVPKASRSAVPLGPKHSDGRGNTIVVGEGPHLWRGSLPNDRTAMICTFRSHTENRAEAAEEYLRHCGYTSTEHPLKVERLNGPAPAREMAEA